MKNISFLIIILFSITSCIEPIELDLNEGDNLKLVIDARIDNSDNDQLVRLSLTSNFFGEDQPEKATGAFVKLEGGNQVYSFTEISDGIYKMNTTFDGESGLDYTLTVEYDETEYTATSTLPKKVELDEAFYEKYNDEPNVDSTYGYDFFISFQEPEGEGDKYAFFSYEKGTPSDLNFDNIGYGEDGLYDGLYLEGIDVTYGDYHEGDTVIIQLMTITQETNDYFLAVETQTDFDQGIFGTPPADVPTNISGEGRGFFLLTGISEKMVILEE